ncbi:MAG: metal-dependent hydrolase [Bacteroidota bacterium]
MTLTYYGHAAFQIETGGLDGASPVTLLFDPFISGNGHAEGIVAADDLAPDVVLLTHAHGDHWGDAPSILQRTNALLVANYEIVTYAGREHGHENAQPMNTGGAFDFGWGRVVQTYARHSSSFPDGTYGGNPNGYILEIGGKTVYITGDTCYFGEMARIGEAYDIDLCILPVGDVVTMGPDEAVACVEVLKPALSLPVHYGTFPFLTGTPDAFAEKARAAGFEARSLKPGETLTL